MKRPRPVPPAGGALRALTVDATGTLIHTPRLGEIYAEVFRRHGRTCDPRAVARLIPEVWAELGCLTDGSTDRFSAHPEGARGWWWRFAERVAERLELPPPSRFATAELYDRFARPDAWEVFPEVVEALAGLRRAGLALAVVANWDDRLPGILAGLGLAPLFDAVVVSGATGYEKPDPRIFAAALAALGVEAEAAAHVGDRLRDDVEGAAALGMRAIWLDRAGAGSGSGTGEPPKRPEPASAVVRSLAELPAALGLAGPTGAPAG